LLKFTADDVIIVTVVRHASQRCFVVRYIVKEEEKSKDDFRCFVFLEDFDFKREKEKSKSDFLCSLPLNCVVID
jgi:hypothetical protein